MNKNHSLLKSLLFMFLATVSLISCEPEIITTENSNPEIEKPGSDDSNDVGSGNKPEDIPSIEVSKNVSAWHWGSETKPYGINFVVNDEQKAAEVLLDYKKYGVKRVYGGYSQIPIHPTQKENLKRWNELLASNSISSFYLTGNAQWIYPENRQQMLDYIQKYYIGYNSTVGLEARFKGLHLDVEPHQLSEWGLASDERKRELMYMLLDTYKDIRQLLISSGMGNDEVMADIPVWFDNIASIGWQSESDRNEWFAQVGTYLDGLSLMAYEVGSIETIISRTEWERTNFKGTVEVGLNSFEIGSVWGDKLLFVGALEKIQAETKGFVAIHSYAVFMQS